MRLRIRAFEYEYCGVKRPRLCISEFVCVREDTKIHENKKKVR